MFEQTLKKERGFIIKRMESDGACLFRAIGTYVGHVTCVFSHVQVM